MGFIRGISRQDADLYYRGGFCVTKKGTPVQIHSFNGPAGDGSYSVNCYIKDRGNDQFAREKMFPVDHINFELPVLGYINDYENLRVLFAHRRVNRGSTRILTHENLYIVDAITGKSISVRPSTVRQLFNPSYTPAYEALNQLLLCKATVFALSADTCMLFSQTADNIIVKVNETPVAYYDPQFLGFRLLPETRDYIEHLNSLFGGRLNVTI